ncbi:hypothetical protein P2H89_23770 [Paraflavitalea sp. CAU 1676]|nr:hypothetical protein [Paraflavitalea sp. CAU 1676]MDF2191483.1 hypothetical protein [Paraflavitalea sp. CAU 1676]
MTHFSNGRTVTPNLGLNMMGFSWVKQERFFPAMHAGYEFMFWQLAIRLQIGAHLSSMGRALKGNTFIRPSVRYNINNRLFAQLGLKTMQGGTADWVEWGLGYQVFQSRRDRN